MKPFRFSLVLANIFFVTIVFAQKKPLDHSVYDGWQHIGEKLISADGRWVVYTVEPQEGDGELIVRSADGAYSQTVPRGHTAAITDDGRYVVFRIKAPFRDLREARIKKKKPEDFPKDSLGVLELGKGSVFKQPQVKSYKIPEEGFGWVAYHREKPVAKKAAATTDKKTDSLQKVIDSLQHLLAQPPAKKKRKKNRDEDELDRNLDIAEFAVEAEGEEPQGSELVLRELATGKEEVFANVVEYQLSEKGNMLLMRQGKDVVLFDLNKKQQNTVSRGFQDLPRLAMSEDGSQIAFVGDRNSQPKDPVKYYQLFYYTSGWDSAKMVADRFSVGMPLGNTVSQHGQVSFSKSGARLFFGTAASPLPKDTSIAEIDIPKLDIWHYNDDYLQTVQLTPNRLRAAQQENFLAVYNTGSGLIQQLGCREIPQVMMTAEGDGEIFFGVTDAGKRIPSQWEGATLRDIYAIDPENGAHELIEQDLFGNIYPSSGGTAIAWYDRRDKKYYAWRSGKVKNISVAANVSFAIEDHDSPGAANNYGIMGWHEGDSAVYVYDKFDAWKLYLDPGIKPVNITKGLGRRNEIEARYVQLDPDKRFFRHGDMLLFRTYNHKNKKRGMRFYSTDGLYFSEAPGEQPYSFTSVASAKREPSRFIYTKENFNQSPDLYYAQMNFPRAEYHDLSGKMELRVTETKLSSINPQQANYLWGTAELVEWKAYNGRDATGIVYKPENFDPKKKYPMIVYFYEKLSQDLYDYKEPAPIRSAVNIPFFVSRGYLIFIPDISYEIGHPGQSAYDYVVSGARAIVKKGWADSTRIAVQGHSWGGYQAAQLATMTKLFKAIWAGAPVANMTSAYGGIRWESGLSRQFQYEKTQSRLGVTPWEDLSLYIENSPLFHLDKVTAPMVILHNDADGAVPWYQGIELFTGLRRLGKKVWMFNYNGQGHGLTQRQDMRDYHIRMQQFFDWILKDEPPARWITDGVPAVDKGRDLGY